MIRAPQTHLAFSPLSLNAGAGALFNPVISTTYVGNLGLLTILRQLNDVRCEAQIEHEDMISPTSDVFELAERYIKETAQLMYGTLPQGYVALDETGGVRFRWRRPERELKFVLPSSRVEDMYIYHSDGTDYAIERDVTAAKLSDWLRWYH